MFYPYFQNTSSNILFICGLFNHAFSKLDYTVSLNEWKVLSFDLKRLWKDKVMAQFKEASQHFLDEIRKTRRAFSLQFQIRKKDLQNMYYYPTPLPNLYVWSQNNN
jgi:hypothetical protein